MEEKGKNKFNLFLVLISTIVLFIAIFSATFAYFTADTSNSVANIEVVTEVSNELVPVYYVSTIGDLYLYASTADMLPSESGKAAASTSKNITVSLIGGSETKPATCTYDFVWKEVTNGYDAYEICKGCNANTYKNEYTLSLTSDTINYNTTVYDAKKLTTGIIVSDTITSSGTSVSKEYKFSAFINNLNVEQYIDGKRYRSTLEVTNVNCSIAS